VREIQIVDLPGVRVMERLARDVVLESRDHRNSVPRHREAGHGPEPLLPVEDDVDVVAGREVRYIPHQSGEHEDDRAEFRIRGSEVHRDRRAAVPVVPDSGNDAVRVDGHLVRSGIVLHGDPAIDVDGSGTSHPVCLVDDQVRDRSVGVGPVLARVS